MSTTRSPLPAALLLASAALLAPAEASAFCGFYVSGADAKLYNNATEVVLMRDGVRTVLSMQNNYQGPPQDFAMVVPVPVVLQKENVKTLPKAIFARVDKLAAPRLVEYWEQDPCQPRVTRSFESLAGMAPPQEESSAEDDARDLGVKIEARFDVGEYNIVILSAQDSLGLDTFLRRQNYKIPAGAEPYLKPYVMGGSKFFVAKVDAKKVRMDKGQANLSPLRFHYDSESFNLPIRLGLINSAGAQDLIVHILARSRYEVANYDNFPIPTNLRVAETVKGNFGAFYAALFDETLRLHPRAVITEYAWSAGSCDPCPEPPLSLEDVGTLGADVLLGAGAKVPPDFVNYLTITRLHARYTKDALGEDLVFRAAPPILGGNGVPDQQGNMTRGAQPGGYNNFQGRYVMLHPWQGPIACAEPHRGQWGGPVQQVAAGPLEVATDTAFAPRGGVQLSSFLAEPAPELAGGDAKLPSGNVKEEPWPEGVQRGGGCAACATSGASGETALGALSALGAIAVLFGRRRARRER